MLVSGLLRAGGDSCHLTSCRVFGRGSALLPGAIIRGTPFVISTLLTDPGHDRILAN